MLNMHTILYPTDFSENSECAFHLATALARDYDAHLIILHVAPGPVAIYGFGDGMLPPTGEWNDDLRQELEEIRVHDPMIRVTRRLEEGDPVTEILRVAKETHADLIVMGTHGRRGLRRMLMGSVSELVVRRAPCPVMTVRTPVQEEVPAGAMEEGRATEEAVNRAILP
jgi:nucleotide-binding universal stress UspA family protein